MSDQDTAWEDMGYGALPEHLRDKREDWQVLGYSSPQERDAERFGDRGGEKPTRRFVTRAREDMSWTPSPTVTAAKCRVHTHGCRNLVDVTEAGMAALEQWSAILVRRGEAPLELNECFFCDPCRGMDRAAACERAAKRRERTTEAIRYLKAISQGALDEAHEAVRAHIPPHPRASAEAIEAHGRLTSLARWLGDGYVADLVTAIREGRRGVKAKPKAGDL